MSNQYRNKKVLNSEQNVKSRFFGKKVLNSNLRESRFRGKRVLILGLGLNQGGVGSARYFAEAEAVVRVTDLKNAQDLSASIEQLKQYPKIEYILGEHRFEDLDWADLIIKNPIIKPDNPYILYAKAHGKKIEIDMGIFLEYVKPSQIIGITGTKGKSTTASIIYQILKEKSKDTVFAGNIGKSVFDTIPYIKKDTLVILELSSFQLEAFSKHQVSPKWAVITNIFPDHLNYYGSMDQYVAAKKAIAQFQTSDDYLIIKKDDPVTDQANFLTGIKSEIKRYSLTDLPKNFSPQLPGEHNLQNFAAVLDVTQLFDIDSKLAISVMEQFTGVEYRLQLVKEWRGIKIYNDSAATNPEATIQALKSLPGCILICGGVNKNLDYSNLAKAISKYAKSVYFLEGDATEELLNTKYLILNTKNKGTYNDLNKLVHDIKSTVKEGNIILLSPGAASFNLFQNEFDRGRQFNLAVNHIFN